MDGILKKQNPDIKFSVFNTAAFKLNIRLKIIIINS